MSKHLHIIALDTPWPVNYGGVIDLFYKLKALHKLEIKVHLHCFSKDNIPQPELNKYCETVQYYQRKKNSQSFSFSIPLMVNSRQNKTLLNNLLKDDHPILLEGIHCTYYFNNGELNNRKVLLRLHNAEFEYYRHFAKHETNLFKKLYFLHESYLLKKYEKKIAVILPIVAVSEQDVTIYKDNFQPKDIGYLPVFLPYTLSVCKEGNGCFCLYHGNLSINENEQAAIWLLKNVFNDIDIHFIIAGRSPSKKLQALVKKNNSACLVADPSETAMQDLVCKAQIHVLPSFNNTGIKLKLLNALFNGRHCVVNEAGVKGSGLQQVCHTATDVASFKKIITQLYKEPFTEQEKEQRQGLLQTIYNNDVNAEKLVEMIWPSN